MSAQKWPVTVTFAFYFDHEPDGHELDRVAAWSENSYDRSGEQNDRTQPAIRPSRSESLDRLSLAANPSSGREQVPETIYKQSTLGDT